MIRAWIGADQKVTARDGASKILVMKKERRKRKEKHRISWQRSFLQGAQHFLVLRGARSINGLYEDRPENWRQHLGQNNKTWIIGGDFACVCSTCIDAWIYQMPVHTSLQSYVKSGIKYVGKSNPVPPLSSTIMLDTITSLSSYTVYCRLMLQGN